MCALLAFWKWMLKISSGRAGLYPICDLQIEYTQVSHRIEAAIPPTYQEPGIGITASDAVSRGFIDGHWQK